MYFLAIWFLGDTSNLLGALFTGQASWQVLVAAYYVSVDIVLVCQYVWYTSLKSKQGGRLGKDEGDSDGGDDDSLEILISSPVEDNHNPHKSSMQATEDGDHAMNTKSVSKSRNSESHRSGKFSEKPQRNIVRLQKTQLPIATSPKAILFTSMLCVVLANASPLKPDMSSSRRGSQPFDELKFAGRILSWTSTLLYLGSRLPQLYKNFTRQSTSGLSPSLFIAAFFGNSFYATSLLTDPLAWSSYPPYGGHGWAGPKGSDRASWVALAAPFWLGSAGVLVMDAAIGVQFLKYGEEPRIKIVVKDERGRGKWRKVSGWMRGWIPSPSPARLSEEAQHDQRPLLDVNDREDSRYGST